jgi:hypothetical protein
MIMNIQEFRYNGLEYCPKAILDPQDINLASIRENSLLIELKNPTDENDV